MDKKTAIRAFIWVILVPYGVYALTHNELKMKGDRRYKNLF